MISLTTDDASLLDLGRVDLWVPVEVVKEMVELGGGRSGDESGTAPMMEESARKVGAGRRFDLLDDELVRWERIGSGGGKEVVGRLVLRREARFNGLDVGVKTGNRWLRRAPGVGWRLQEGREGNKGEERGCTAAPGHELDGASGVPEMQGSEARLPGQ